ncbi:hypothetical protein BHM03_00018566 [Ensete ventricosum]|nr:hypothetical protein BHM03_00018566 [Ensete ventricosum]
MTKAIHTISIKDDSSGNIGNHFKDQCIAISDHLCNHVHLTNCIHSKNHMHHRSPNIAGRSLMRDLIVLQKSRSLRDPSASPPSWVSPYTVGGFARISERKATTNGRRISIGDNCWREAGRLSHGRHESKTNNEAEENTCDHYRRPNLGKKCRLKGARRARRSIDLRGIGDHRNLTNASDSVAVASKSQKAHLENVAEDTELEVAWTQRNVCGIPWNWSRIHYQGKTFLDIAGRSLSCGLSDFRTKKAEGLVPQKEGNTSNMFTALDHLTPTSSDSEVLPLLTEVPESQGNDANCLLSRGYSGELEIFSNHSLRHYTYSDLSSDARSSHKRYRLFGHGRHSSLTQKYMPKTFKDLVGQNLVVQALSNAIMRRKVGLIYVFHGHHGTGKTSCARVFATALNCLSQEVFQPCGVCSSCISNDLGRSRDVLELGPVGNFDFESIKDAFDNMMLLPRSSMYRVSILDDCDGLPSNLWSTISKVIDRSPRHVIFILICSNLDSLPHIIISRCQKFFFPKVRDSDIISTLQWITTSEGLEIDKDALKFIASQSDGSLRDAEMTLDQINLLGKKISLPLVEELVSFLSFYHLNAYIAWWFSALSFVYQWFCNS